MGGGPACRWCSQWSRRSTNPSGPCLKAKLRAKKAAIPVWGLADLGLDDRTVGLSGSFTQVVKVFPPPARGKSEVWTGDPAELAGRLWQRLKEQSPRARCKRHVIRGDPLGRQDWTHSSPNCAKAAETWLFQAL